MTSPSPEPDREADREADDAPPHDHGIDPAWLNRVLNRAGFDGRLLAVEPRTVGTGQMGDSIRCRLTWEPGPGATEDRPGSVVVKLPSSDETSRNTGGATGAYRKEVGFYRDAAPSVAMRVPRVHHLWEDLATNRFVLVMEDIAPAEQGDQLSGCSLERAELAIDAAAALHGSTWGRVDELAQLEWLQESDQRIADRVGLFDLVFPGFVDRYEDRLSADDLAFGRWLAEHYGPWLENRSQRECLVHGDFRLDNILYGLGEPAPPLTTVDWQTVSLGPALSDVAYFLSGSLTPDQLATDEPTLLDRYRRGLGHHGVDLDADQIADGYRLGAPAGYVMAVIASQIVVQTERGDDMFLVMARGSAALAGRLDTVSALG